jgi:hypothetical protein
VDATEIEAALEELEQRVERLRALYEQYFLGIEKIEPAVLRKDVERRFWILRRTQIRNTAMRFKLNTVNQRYNTYQQYWQRSVREIEAGTYRRHVLRAEKRFGQDALTITARKRFARAGAESPEEMGEREERARRALDQVTDLDAFDDIDFGDPDVFSVPRAPVQAPAVAPAHGLDELDDLESLMGLDAGPTVRGVPRSVAPAPRASKPGPRPHTLPSSPSPTSPSKAADDFGDIGGMFAEDGNDRTAPHVRLPLPTAPASAPRHAPKPSAAPQPLPPPRLPPLPVPPQRPSQPRAPERPSQPQTPQAPPRSPQAAGQHPLPVPPPRVPAPQRPSQPQPQRPSQPQPPQRPSQPQRPSPPQPAQRPPQGAPPSGLSDERVREIYRDYVNAKRQCNESTSAITEASLAQSLRGSADKLSQKHKGRRIDYEVVIKDGRAVLKPVVKS